MSHPSQLLDSAVSNADLVLNFLATLHAEDSYPYFPLIQERKGTHVQMSGGSAALMFGSCDYLGLSQDPRMIQAAKDALDRFGTNTCGAQMFCGYTVYHDECERKLRTLFGRRCLLFPSGMHANCGILGSLLCSEDVVINDRLNHGSILLGCKLSGATIRTYPHNDMGRLEELLRDSSKARIRMIVVDGLFSADGDVAALKDICALAKRYDALTMVDEAHSFGVLGPSGLGVADSMGVLDDVDIVMGTMSKAVGSVGGFVGASDNFIEVIRHQCPFYTSSRGLAPPVVAAVNTALDIMMAEGAQLRGRLLHNVHFLIAQLREAEFDTLTSASPIVPVMIRDGRKTAVAAAWLQRQGIITTAMLYPSVPSGAERLRLGVTALHSEADCLFVVEKLREIRAQVGF